MALRRAARGAYRNTWGVPKPVGIAMSDVLTVLAGLEYESRKHDSLRLDERYRTRHLPLLAGRPRGPLGPDPGPREYWPPARSLVVPLPDPRPEPFLSAHAWYAEDFTTWLEHFATGGTSWQNLLPRP
jgi:hypothetical protein